MADLVIDYGLLHRLATNARALRENLDISLPRGNRDTGGSSYKNYGGGTGSSGRSDVLASDGPSGVTQLTSGAVGNPGLFGQLTTFYTAWDKPFHDSMDRLKDLADLLDGVATKFFDVDADFAGKADHMLIGFKTNEWEARKAQYEHYLSLRDKSVTYQYYDADGNLVTQTLPLWDPDTPAPEMPGDPPTSSSMNGADGSITLNPDGTTKTETTTVKSPDGLSYTETTTYTYGTDTDGDGKPNVVSSSTTITHSDGTNETITRTNNHDGTYVITDTTPDGKSTTTIVPTGIGGGYQATVVDHEGKTTTVDVIDNPDGTTDTKTVHGPKSVEVYTGDAASDSWKLVSDSPVEDPRSDLPPKGGQNVGGGPRKV